MTLQGHLFAAPLHTDIQKVSVSLIVPPDTTEVIPSVGLVGVLQSVLLKPGGTPEQPYLIVDGDRRVNSALKYQLAEVPAVITDGTRGQIAAASALLNAARSSNPLDEARSWRTALEEGQFGGVEDLARHVRVSVQKIKKRLKLLNLPEELLCHIGVSIAEGVAERMANLPDEYRAQAVDAASRKLDAGEKFTAADLKGSQTARRADLSGSLDDLFSGTPPLLTVPRDPLADLVAEVRRLADLSGLDIHDVVRALGGAPASETLAPAPPPTAIRPPAGRVNLGLRSA